MAYIIVVLGLYIALFIVRMSLGNTSGAYNLEFSFSQTAGKRQINADEIDWAYFGDETFFAIADGIGAGSKAKTAARVAAHIISRVFEQTGIGGNAAYFFMNAFRGANATVLRYIPDGSAGASLLGVAISGDLVYYALAGNCKISIFRNGELHDLSEGHTFDVLARRAFIREEISRKKALEAVKINRIYNFVGKDGFRDLEMFDTPVKLKRGDILILMTDGVYEFCPTQTLTALLDTRASCQVMAKKIIKTLEEFDNPNQDNASVIVARINSLPAT